MIGSLEGDPGLSSVLLEMEPSSEPDVIGDHIHGWFMGWVKALDAALGDELHEKEGGKPFAVWAGPRFALGPGGTRREGSDTMWWLRVSSLDSRLSEILPTLGRARTIRLGSSVFTVSAMYAGTQHPWTGTSSGQAILDRWSADPVPEGRVRI